MNHMDKQKDNSTIHCNIHQNSYTSINAIKQKINRGSSVVIKAKYAEELSDQVACLIDCQQYDNQKQACNDCRMIADLHKKTADLIMNAKRLSQ